MDPPYLSATASLSSRPTGKSKPRGRPDRRISPNDSDGDSGSGSGEWAHSQSRASSMSSVGSRNGSWSHFRPSSRASLHEKLSSRSDQPAQGLDSAVLDADVEVGARGDRGQEDPGSHKCRVCGEGFPRRRALIMHMSIHPGERPYRCTVITCERSFIYRADAQCHSKRHELRLKTCDRVNRENAENPFKSSPEGKGDNSAVDSAEMELSDIPVTAWANHPDPDLSVSSTASSGDENSEEGWDLTNRHSHTRHKSQPPTSEIPPGVDPHVAAFLKSVLGSRKWRIFSSKLCERKDVGNSARRRGNEASTNDTQKGKGKTFSASCPDERDGVPQGGTSPCAIAFLVKVEVVKEALRNYVPNPYRPLKADLHLFPAAPGGVVHVTRASVLSLSQWSNTQFAYWSRRSEAVSVLASHDAGLRDLFHVLYQRLYQRNPPSHAFVTSSPSTSASSSSAASSSGPPPPPSQVVPGQRNQPVSRVEDASETERRLRVARGFTGKGLDGLITQVKRRTGASQFLRGRQSSLDPFGAYLKSGIAAYDPNWPIVMPSVHGKQTHSRTPSAENYDISMPHVLTPGCPATSSSLMGSTIHHRRGMDDANTADLGSPTMRPAPRDISDFYHRSVRGSERYSTPPSRASTTYKGHSSSGSSSPASIDTRSSSQRGSFRETYGDGSSFTLSNGQPRPRGLSTGRYNPYSPSLKRTKGGR